MAFKYTGLKPSTQRLATTGRSPDFSRMLRKYMQAQFPALRAQKAAEERQRLEEEALDIQEEEQKQAERMGLAGVGVSTAGIVPPAVSMAKDLVGTKEMATAQNVGKSFSLFPDKATPIAAAKTKPFTLFPEGMPSVTSPGSGATGLSSAGSLLGPLGVAAGIETGHQLLKGEADELAGKLPGGEAEWRTTERGLTRAGQGAAIGSLGGPIGTAIGGAVGGVVGVIEGASDCIIVTACTDRNSYEVNITREYRDKFLDLSTLRGYYILAEMLVPKLKKHKWLQRLTKYVLVDSLIDTGEQRLGYKQQTEKKRSPVIADIFLGICKTLGMVRREFVRSNGEVY